MLKDQRISVNRNELLKEEIEVDLGPKDKTPRSLFKRAFEDFIKKLRLEKASESRKESDALLKDLLNPLWIEFKRLTLE